MTYEQKKFEGYTEGQMAREILMNALPKHWTLKTST